MVVEPLCSCKDNPEGDCDKHTEGGTRVRTDDGLVTIIGYTYNVTEYSLDKNAEPEPIRVWAVTAHCFTRDNDGVEGEWLGTRNYYFVVEDCVQDDLAEDNPFYEVHGMSMDRTTCGESRAKNDAMLELSILLTQKGIPMYDMPDEDEFMMTNDEDYLDLTIRRLHGEEV